jgi:hypothetical protein
MPLWTMTMNGGERRRFARPLTTGGHGAGSAMASPPADIG